MYFVEFCQFIFRINIFVKIYFKKWLIFRLIGLQIYYCYAMLECLDKAFFYFIRWYSYHVFEFFKIRMPYIYIIIDLDRISNKLSAMAILASITTIAHGSQLEVANRRRSFISPKVLLPTISPR